MRGPCKGQTHVIPGEESEGWAGAAVAVSRAAGLVRAGFRRTQSSILPPAPFHQHHPRGKDKTPVLHIATFPSQTCPTLGEERSSCAVWVGVGGRYGMRGREAEAHEPRFISTPVGEDEGTRKALSFILKYFLSLSATMPLGKY